MQQYKYTTPQILTDSLFTLYGGQTGTSSAAQRQIAYLLAEEQMYEYLGSYLVPTTVTGTYFWRGKTPLELDHGWVTRIISTTLNSVSSSNCCTFDSVSGCHTVRNSQYGYLDVFSLVSCGGCSSILGLPPYNIQVVYESGLSTGTYTNPSFLQAMVILSQIEMNELDASLSNETIGDAGIEFFINQGYHEKRIKTFSTTFGNSPLASRASRLVRKYRARPSVSIY